MLQSFYKYLILHHKACIPGIGIFSVVKKPAEYFTERKVFSPPQYVIQFSPGNAMADRKFYSFLGKEHQTDDVTVIRQFNELSCALWEELNAKKTIQLPQIGQLSVNAAGDLQWEPINHLRGYFTDVELVKTEDIKLEAEIQPKEVPVIKKIKLKTPQATDEEASAIKKDVWWIVALVLTVIAVASIVYYYSVLVK